MKYFVKTKPNAREESVIQTDANHFAISVKEPPFNGKANEAAAKALAEFLEIPSSRIRLKKGATSRNKIFETR